jgi:hypothetical protein
MGSAFSRGGGVVSAVLDAASATSRAHGRLWGAARAVVVLEGAGLSITNLARALDAVEEAEAELAEALASRPPVEPSTPPDTTYPETSTRIPGGFPACGWRVTA